MQVIIILLILWYLCEKIDIIRHNRKVKRYKQYQLEQKQAAKMEKERQRAEMLEIKQAEKDRKTAIREHKENIKLCEQRFRSIQRTEKAERTIEIYSSILENMQTEIDSLQRRIDYCKEKNLPYSGLSEELFKLQKKMLSYSDRVFNASQVIELENFRSA